MILYTDILKLYFAERLFSLYQDYHAASAAFLYMPKFMNTTNDEISHAEDNTPHDSLLCKISSLLGYDTAISTAATHSLNRQSVITGRLPLVTSDEHCRGEYDRDIISPRLKYRRYG